MINNYCELCGEKIDKPFYLMIFSFNYLIFEKNVFNQSINNTVALYSRN